jgi:hypothetical protein
MRVRLCYLDCHEAELCCYLVIHTETLLRALQLFYFHLWPIYWLSLVLSLIRLTELIMLPWIRNRLQLGSRSCFSIPNKNEIRPTVKTSFDKMNIPAFGPLMPVSLYCLSTFYSGRLIRKPLKFNQNCSSRFRGIRQFCVLEGQFESVVTIFYRTKTRACLPTKFRAEIIIQNNDYVNLCVLLNAAVGV